MKGNQKKKTKEKQISTFLSYFLSFLSVFILFYFIINFTFISLIGSWKATPSLRSKDTFINTGCIKFDKNAQIKEVSFCLFENPSTLSVFVDYFQRALCFPGMHMKLLDSETDSNDLNRLNQVDKGEREGIS